QTVRLGAAVVQTAASVGVLIAAHQAQAVTAFWSSMRGGVGVMKALNVAMRANPIGLIATGLELAVAGVSLLYQNFEGVRNFIDGIWASIKKFFAVMGGGMLKKLGFNPDAFDAKPDAKPDGGALQVDGGAPASGPSVPAVPLAGLPAGPV
ncbi:MAG: hypothetical protein HQL35_16220, partial [Alphaproteobacteria bacterium]|nr:hypothetical protein [Alphaproteobacteria bacterium]